MYKLQIIKKELEYPCYCCKTSIRGKTISRKDCKVCHGTGIFKDEVYYHVYGKQCFLGDTVK